MGLLILLKIFYIYITFLFLVIISFIKIIFFYLFKNYNNFGKIYFMNIKYNIQNN